MGIFINFRNGDSEHFINLLDVLAVEQFGDDEVFRSRRSIMPGVDYRPELINAVGRSQVLLAVIGPDWLVRRDGIRRIDDPGDWVRREIAFAFERGKRVIPVIIGPPRPRLCVADDLPADIADIVHRQSFAIDQRNPELSIRSLLEMLIRIEPELAIGVVPGLERIAKWRDRWLRATEPPLPPSLLLAGREKAVAELREWVAGPAAVRTVCSTSVDDVIAFVAAVHAEYLARARAVVALEGSGIRHCERLCSPLLVVATPELLDARALLDQGHHVLVARQGTASGREPGALSLPRLSVQEASQILEQAGLPLSRAHQLAGIGRRSLTALRRRMAVHAGEPAWATPQQAIIASAVLLAGTWSDEDSADCEVLAELVGRPWTEIAAFAAGTARSDDPFLHRSGTRWQLADPMDAWWALSDELKKEVLGRWHRIAVDLLTEADPLLEVEPSRRVVERYRGTRRRASDEIRRGIAIGAALLGAGEETRLDHSGSAAEFAAALVRAVFKRCNEDRSGLRWRSIAPELRWLAEAAPTEFLGAVENGLNGSEPVLRHLFTNPDGDEMTGRHSPHVYLLWAIEVVCWSPDHLPRGARLLARLAEIYPGGRTTSQPLNALRRIFHPGMPYTATSAPVRLRVIDGLRKTSPEVRWSLLLELVPTPDQLHMRTLEPEFRTDWVPDDLTVSPDEARSNLDAVVDRLLSGVVEDQARWVAVIERLRWVSPEQARRIVEQLHSVDTDALANSLFLAIWEVTRSLVASHRYFASGLLPDDVAKALESWVGGHTPYVPQHYAWLFDWHPRIPGFAAGDWRASEGEANRLRQEAVQTVFESSGIAGLLQIAEASRRPDLVGVITVDAIGDALLGEAVGLLGADNHIGRFAEGWVQRAVATVDGDWTARLSAIMPSLNESQQAALLLATTWSAVIRPLVDVANEAVNDRFWAQVAPWPTFGDPDWFIAQLLDHDRPWATIDTMSVALMGNDDHPWRPAVDQVLAALVLAMRPDTSDRPCSGISAHAIRQLVDFLEGNEVDDLTLVRLELMFRPVLGPSQKTTVFGRVLARNPQVYAEIVDLAYGEPHDDGLVWVQAQFALSDWRTLPGETANGGIDPQQLHHWVRAVRAELSGSGPLVGHSEGVIGGMLSGSPAGVDGAWPAEPIRDLLEEPGNDRLVAGFIDGTTMNQGPTFRGAVEGGQQERALADKYMGLAGTIAPEWPRSADVLRSCAEQFRRLGRMWDDEGEDWHDEA